MRAPASANLAVQPVIARRAFMVGSLVTAASPLPARAQQTTAKVWRIGILGNENTRPWEIFRQALRDLGYVDGRNLALEQRWSEGITERLPELAAELVQRRVDVIVASGTQAVRAAKSVTKAIPIVMAVSAYPDKIGLVDSLTRPGGNVTGLTNIAPELAPKRLELLKEIVPQIRRVMYIWNPSSPVEPIGFQDMLAAGRATGVEILTAEVRKPDDYPPGVCVHQRIAAARVDRLRESHQLQAPRSHHRVRTEDPDTERLRGANFRRGRRTDVLCAELQRSVPPRGGACGQNSQGRQCGGSAGRASSHV